MSVLPLDNKQLEIRDGVFFLSAQQRVSWTGYFAEDKVQHVLLSVHTVMDQISCKQIVSSAVMPVGQKVPEMANSLPSRGL